mgnify:CR=1 FL=1
MCVHRQLLKAIANNPDHNERMGAVFTLERMGLSCEKDDAQGGLRSGHQGGDLSPWWNAHFVVVPSC